MKKIQKTQKKRAEEAATMNLRPCKIDPVKVLQTLIGPAFFGRLLAVTLLAGTSIVAFSSAVAQVSPPQASDVSPSVNVDVSSMIHTGCGYDAWTGSVRRSITDLEVPGAVSSLGLKWVRTYNSGPETYPGGWNFSWTWRYWGRGWGGDPIAVHLPDGGIWRAATPNIEPGNKLRFLKDGDDPINGCSHNPANGCANLYLEDGSRVYMTRYSEPPCDNCAVVDYYQPQYVQDPYGRQTTLDYEQFCSNNTVNADLIRLQQITDPSGRWIRITYACDQNPNDCNCDQFTWWKITRVDGSNGSWVKYHYGNDDPNFVCNTDFCVQYSDGTRADYTYGDTTYNWYDPYQGHYVTAHASKLIQAKDTHADCPMQWIQYDYASASDSDPSYFEGRVRTERHLNISSGQPDVPVSTLTCFANCPVKPTSPRATVQETRGDGPSRTLYIQKDQNGNGKVPLVMSKSDFNGISENFTYDSNNYLQTAQDRNGNTTSFSDTNQTEIGNPTTITHPSPDNSHIDYTYSDTNNPYHVRTVADERTNTTTYWRDANNRIYQIDYPTDQNTPVSHEYFSYNNFGQVQTHTLKNGAVESFVYDTNGTGLLTDKYNPKPSATPGGSDPHTHYDYYTSGPWKDRVQTITLPPNFPNSLQATDTYEYDRDTSGNEVPGRGLVTKITHADPNNQSSYESFGYDAFGNKTWEENELRKHTSYTYDDYKRRLTIADPLTYTTRYDYSPAQGNTTQCYSHTTNSPYYVTTPTGIVTNNGYDNNFRKTSTTAAYNTSSAATTWFHYDPVGNQDHVTDPRGSHPCNPTCDPTYTTTTDYDVRNRKWHVWDAQGHETTFTYDAASNVTEIDHPDGGWEQKSYDAVNRVLSDSVLKTSTPSQVILTTWFTYNPSGTLAAVTDANGSARGDPNHTTTFGYDASDQRTLMTYPAVNGHQDTQTWMYDAAHNLEYRITTNSQQQEMKIFYYDIRNRKYAHWWNNWQNNIVDWGMFQYDAANRLTEAENGTGGYGKNVISDVHRTYDDDNRLTLEQQNLVGLGSTFVNYGYDNDGKVNHLWVNNVADYNYTFTYDPMGRFEKIFITNPSTPLFQYYYDAASNERERDNVYIQSPVTQSYPRDNLNRMSSLDVRYNGNPLEHEGYTYDTMNRLTSVDWGNNVTDSFTPYLDGELSQAQYGNFNHTVTFTLDNAGNRMIVTDNGTPTTYNRNYINQYTGVSGSTITNGNDHQISGYNSATFTYMNDERLAWASSGSTTYSMLYDALGRCVKRTWNNAGPTLSTTTSTYYIYDGEKPILEYDAGGTRVGFNLYGKGIDEILERGAYGTDNQWYWYFFQQNHEGSVTLLTDGSGNVIERYRYDAFGVPTIYGPNWGMRSATSYDNRFLFTGREYAATYRSTYNTPAFNFYEYRARTYNPTLGRFMSEDPKVFDAGDYNLFRYCHNDPIDMTDPMGLWVEPPESYSTWRTDPFQSVIGFSPMEGDASRANSYFAAKQAANQVATTGQLTGGSADYSRAAMGNRNDPNAPSRLQIVGTEAAKNGTIFQLQLQTGGRQDLTGNGAALENVKLLPTTGNIAVQESRTTNDKWVAFGKGLIKDYVSLTPLGPRANGEVYKSQTYQVYYGGFRYNIITSFSQYSQVVNGQVTINSLASVDPYR